MKGYKMTSDEKPKFSLGIDIGSSYSCISLCDLSQDPPYWIIKLFGKEGSMPSGIIPSVILYDSDGKVVRIGEEALNIYLAGNDTNDTLSNYTLVREFKAQFNRQFFLGDDKPVEYEKAYEEFFERLFSALRDALEIEEGRVCITHPARKKSEDNIGPRIIALAGRVLGDKFVVEGLDEASALVQFLDREEGFLSIKPRKILVIDSGGGTTDFAFATASYSLLGSRSPLEIEFTDRRDSGGRDIDQVLYQKAQEQLGVLVTNPVQKERDLRDLRRNKEMIDWTNPEGFKFTIPVDNHNFEFSEEGFLQAIEPVLLNCLEPILTMAGLEELDVIVLAGGNSLLPPFRAALEKTLGESKVQFKYKPRLYPVKVEDVKTAVSKGASLYVNRTNKQLKFRLGYSVSIVDEINGRAKILWKQGISFPPRNRRYVETMISNPETSRIKIQRRGESALLYDLMFAFTEPVESGLIRAYFEIDGNGYLRYHGEPFGKKNQSKQEMIRQFLFETTPPSQADISTMQNSSDSGTMEDT